MGDEEENDDNIVGKEYPGGRVGLNCRVIKEEDKVIVEEINHGFINDGYDDVLYEANGEKTVGKLTVDMIWGFTAFNLTTILVPPIIQPRIREGSLSSFQ